MASKKLVVFENGKYRGRDSSAETLDFSSVRIGASTLEIKETSSHFDFSAKKLTNLAAPAADGDAATKAYVDQKAITGGIVKEALLSSVQLDGTDGINAAESIYFNTIPVADDTVIIKNGSTTETFTFKASESVAFDVAIGVDAATTMANLAQAINDDSTAWDALYTVDGLDSINAGGVVVVYEQASAAGASDSRLYGVWGTQSDCKVVEYNGETEYATAKAAISLPSEDPAAGRFGLRKEKSALENGEIHLLLATDELKEWDEDGDAWQTLSGSGSLPDATSAAGGGIKGKVTFDSDKGVSVTGGIASIKKDGATIDFDGSGQLYVPNGGLANAQIASDAAIVETKLSLDYATGSLHSSITDHTGSTSNPHSVTKAQVLTGDLIVNTDVDAAAAIVESKLSLDYATGTLNTAITNHTGSTSNPHSVTKAQVLTGDLIVNTDVDAAAAIVESKLSLDYATGTLNTAITNHTGSTSNPHSVTKAQVLTGDLIVNADVDAAAAIVESKLSLDYATGTLNTAITNHTGSTSNPHSVTKAQVLTGDLIVNADVDAAAAIVESKLSLDYATGTLNTAITNHTGSTSNPHSVTKAQVLTGDLIVNADVDAAAAIAYSKLSLSGSIANGDLAGSIADSKLDQLTTAYKVAASAFDYSVSKTNDNAGAITIRQCVYIKSNGNVDLAQATVSNLCNAEVGFVEDASIASTEAGKITLVDGKIISGFSGLTPGDDYFVDPSTPGAITNTPPTASGQTAYPVGRAISATTLKYQPGTPIEFE